MSTYPGGYDPAIFPEPFSSAYRTHLQHLKLKGLQPKTIEAYSRTIRRIGDHLWDLACSVDILEILAEVDPVRAIELVPESTIVQAESSEMKWRAQRGRVALTTARTGLAASMGLTSRQITVMNGLLQDLTINEIAQQLGFSHSTVRQESIAIYKALQIEGRTAIAERARQLQLF